MAKSVSVADSATKNANNAAMLLGKLTKAGTKAPVNAKPQKWELPLTHEAKTAALRWINAKSVSEPVDSRLSRSRDEFGEYALEVMADRLIQNNSKPSNPIVVIYKEDGKTPDHQFQYSLQDRFKKFDLPAGDIDIRDHFVSSLMAVGLNIKNAVGNLVLINARESHPLVQSAYARGFDPDQGIVVIYNDQYYFGADGTHFLALLNSPHGMLNALTASLLRVYRQRRAATAAPSDGPRGRRSPARHRAAAAHPRATTRRQHLPTDQDRCERHRVRDSRSR